MEVTLITGASSGIGEALAIELAQGQSNLLLIARSQEKLEHLCQELSQAYGIEASFIAIDLSAEGAAEQVFQETQRRGFQVVELINNAGIGSTGEFRKQELAAELAMLQLNIMALVALCHLFLPEMIRLQRGRIVNIASVVGYFPSPYMAVYAASKSFVRSFTHALQAETAGQPIHILLFSPGLTKTNFMSTSAMDPQWTKSLLRGSLVQTAEQVAKSLVRACRKNKNSQVPGFTNRLATRFVGLLPHGLLARWIAIRARKKVVGA